MNCVLYSLYKRISAAALVSATGVDHGDGLTGIILADSPGVKSYEAGGREQPELAFLVGFAPYHNPVDPFTAKVKDVPLHSFAFNVRLE